MFRHYLIAATRGLIRHKLYTAINIIGLAVALACAILILLFVKDQLSWDDWIPDTTHLYRLEERFHLPGLPLIRLALCPFPVLTAVGKEIPGVKAVTHVVPEQMTVTADGHQSLETVTVVDPNFFQVIRLPLRYGVPNRVLAQPESVVLTQREARKFFGEENPIGQTLKVSGIFPDACKPKDNSCFTAVHVLRVTGVLRNLPHNTQLVANFLVPNTSRADQLPREYKEGAVGWSSTGGDYGYVELSKGVAPESVLAALKPILDRSVDVGSTIGGRLTGSQIEGYALVPFRDAHLTSDNYSGMRPGGSWTMVYGFSAIALLIVLVACCNFMNLATARATVRAREIGVRKASGAKRGQLIVQFVSEAVLAALIALAIALALVEVLLPAFDGFLGAPITIHYLADWKLLTGIAVGTAVIGLLSGLYPALVLSGFRPTAALKSSGSPHGGSGLTRSGLVVGQFAVSIGLGVAVLVVFRQMSFERDLNLGFDRHDVVVVRGTINLSPSSRQRLKRVLLGGRGISGVALSSVVPFDNGQINDLIVTPKGSQNRTTAQFLYITPRFPSLYDMRLLSGRLLSVTRGTDLSAASGVQNVLINAVAARRFGYSPSEAVGRVLIAQGGLRYRVVGVLQDAITVGLLDAAQPEVFVVSPDLATLLSVRVKPGRLPDALAYINQSWRTLAPGVAIDRYFLSDTFSGLFRPQEREGTLFGVFVGVAIFIACLGLFGLAVFTAERRTKEVGIRRVSGARTRDLVKLMLWRISIPVLMANIIAWPVTYYYLHRWLQGYANRIALNPLYFVGAGLGALLVAWATVYGNSVRLARTNPIHALRYE